MVKNKTRQKPANAWVSLCLVTKRLANWGELLSGTPAVRACPGVPKRRDFPKLRRFFFDFVLEVNLREEVKQTPIFKVYLVGLEHILDYLLMKTGVLLMTRFFYSCVV